MTNDKIVPADSLDPVYFDRGTYFGDGVYEVLRSYDGRIFALGDHFARFTRSLQEIEITGIGVETVKNRVLEAFKEAKISNAKIYFHVTRGSGPRDHAADKGLTPNFFLTISQIHENLKPKKEGIKVSTHPDWRWKRCDIKSLNLLANVMARRDAAQKGCSEAILVDESGLITEGAASTFFAIIDKKLYSSPLSANILPSITRKYIAKAAQELGIEVVEQSITPDQAKSADELFIAATTADITPVVSFDGKDIYDGKPGETTLALARQFRAFI
ncbi:MAG: aminotransferase class IV [Phycisphaerae bacterium]|nr:aminotransferase class IV [Phycisphaerae bacterium]